MAVESVSRELIHIALDRVEGTPFERFVNDFYPAIAGGSYVPLGGYKDGGADAFEGRTYQRSSKAEIYYQASVEQDAESKIRRTVQRLREFGRAPGS